uniref:hypothetical protein n=1 Tax=Enhygromyxa salina TaxID=215803 RepID=UPI00358E1718
MFGWPTHRAQEFGNLRSWCRSLGLDEAIAPFVRHTSFTRPVYVTRKDTDDLRALWERSAQRFRSWGLFDYERPRKMNADNASRKLNLAFADAVNAKLSDLARRAEKDRYFDLVVVDEAQCLRHPQNQTNTVLHRILDGQVDRWLFMSATPVHGSTNDLFSLLDHYPGAGELLPREAAADLPRLQRELRRFLVRRQRRYRTAGGETEVAKTEYRRHDRVGWGVRDDQMSVLGTLAMGLVQKRLVPVLEGRNNRFRIGFLSSFESLQSSLRGTGVEPSDTRDATGATDEAGDAHGDWHRDVAEGAAEAEAPDSGFVTRLSEGFRGRFGRDLPHPKIDAVVSQVAPLAFGTAEQAGGVKFLIFTRRVSTVETLRRRLISEYHRTLEARIHKSWKRRVDWERGGGELGE